MIYSSGKPSVVVNKAKHIVGAMKLEHVKMRNSKIAAQVKLISPPLSKAYAYLRELQQTLFIEVMVFGLKRQ